MLPLRLMELVLYQELLAMARPFLPVEVEVEVSTLQAQMIFLQPLLPLQLVAQASDKGVLEVHSQDTNQVVSEVAHLQTIMELVI